MKRSLVIFTLLLTITTNIFADKADSLKNVLNLAVNDTARVNALNDLALYYLYSRPDTSLVLAQKAIDLSRQAGYEKGEANGLQLMGIIFLAIGDYPKALDFELQALKTFEKLNDMKGLNSVYLTMGSIYTDQGEFKKAILYFHKSRLIPILLNKPELAIASLINLGDAYEKINQLDSARIYTNQAYELALRYREKYPDTFAITLNNLGNIHSRMKQDKIALEYYHMSFKELTKNMDMEGLCETILGMAEIFKREGKPDSTLFYSRMALATGLKGGFTKRVLNASSFLSDYFKGLNRVDSAYRYQQITIAAKDSLFSQEKVKAVQNLTFQEQIRQQEIAEASRKTAEERSANIQMLGIGTFITFFFGFLFVFGRKKSNQKVVQFLGLMGLLLLFEFISLFMHPYIAAWTHHIPVLMLLILVGIASVLVPLHHRLQEIVRAKLARKVLYAVAE